MLDYRIRDAGLAGHKRPRSPSHVKLTSRASVWQPKIGVDFRPRSSAGRLTGANADARPSKTRWAACFGKAFVRAQESDRSSGLPAA